MAEAISQMMVEQPLHKEVFVGVQLPIQLLQTHEPLMDRVLVHSHLKSQALRLIESIM